MKVSLKIFILFSLSCIAVLSLNPAIAGAPPKQGRYGEVTLTLSELQTLADAMDRVYLDIGYYVSIEHLNDLLSDYTVYDFDNIDQFDGTWVINLTTARFHPDKVDLSSPYHLWQGPYVTYHESRFTIDGDGYDRGTLLDFWGTPYYLFSPAGLVRTDQHTITQELYGDYFDVYAIVSLGPDCVKSDDDLWRSFGVPPTRVTLTSISSPRAFPGDPLVLRGYNLGTRTRGEPQLLLGGVPVDTFTSWSENQIEFTVPQGATSGELKVVMDTDESNPLYLAITEHPTAAVNWTLYQ